jgi:anti-sigma-K factor RskA
VAPRPEEAVSPPDPIVEAQGLALEPAIQERRASSWRSFSLVASGAVATALLMPLLMNTFGASYVAVLSDARTQKPVLLVSAGRRSGELRVKTLEPAIHVAEASLQLWALPKGGKPRSLGVVSGAKAVLQLGSSAERALADVPMLAVSLEPKGGSRSGLPSGPMLYSGPCVKDW